MIYLFLFIFEVFAYFLAANYLIDYFYNRTLEVDEALAKGIISHRSEKRSLKYKAYIKVKRCQKRMLELRRQLKACQIEYDQIVGGYEKKDY